PSRRDRRHGLPRRPCGGQPRGCLHPPHEGLGRRRRSPVVTAWSFTRFWGIVLKEFLQLRRDRVTFGMIIGVPIIQLLLFGYAINTDPKHLRTAVIEADSSEFTRSYLAAMKTTGYFELVGVLPDEESGRAA